MFCFVFFFFNIKNIRFENDSASEGVLFRKIKYWTFRCLKCKGIRKFKNKTEADFSGKLIEPFFPFLFKSTLDLSFA